MDNNKGKLLVDEPYDGETVLLQGNFMEGPTIRYTIVTLFLMFFYLFPILLILLPFMYLGECPPVALLPAPKALQFDALGTGVEPDLAVFSFQVHKNRCTPW
jgi:hypothetical protein